MDALAADSSACVAAAAHAVGVPHVLSTSGFRLSPSNAQRRLSQHGVHGGTGDAQRSSDLVQPRAVGAFGSCELLSLRRDGREANPAALRASNFEVKLQERGCNPLVNGPQLVVMAMIGACSLDLGACRRHSDVVHWLIPSHGGRAPEGIPFGGAEW
jgi:hypothetical protein